MQRINHHVFRDPPQVTENIARVTAHLRSRLAGPDAERRVLTLVPSAKESWCATAEDGTFWRMYRWIEATRTFLRPDTPERAAAAARAFGEFQRQLLDFPAASLVETIPRFHDTPNRMDALRQAADEDVCGRLAGVSEEAAFALRRTSQSARLLDLHARGDIPSRVVHNDAKIANVLFDERTEEALCVVDLDTVMPGLSLFDFGDMLRSMAGNAEEDEIELGAVRVDPALFEAVARGYLSSAREFLTPAEREHLLLAGWLITLEQGVRFLTDYLQGDRYYKTTHPGHNLQRCQAQFSLVRSFEQLRTDLEAIVSRCL